MFPITAVFIEIAKSHLNGQIENISHILHYNCLCSSTFCKSNHTMCFPGERLPLPNFVSTDSAPWSTEDRTPIHTSKTADLNQSWWLEFRPGHIPRYCQSYWLFNYTMCVKFPMTEDTVEKEVLGTIKGAREKKRWQEKVWWKWSAEPANLSVSRGLQHLFNMIHKPIISTKTCKKHQYTGT